MQGLWGGICRVMEGSLGGGKGIIVLVRDF